MVEKTALVQIHLITILVSLATVMTVLSQGSKIKDRPPYNIRLSFRYYDLKTDILRKLYSWSEDHYIYPLIISDAGAIDMSHELRGEGKNADKVEWEFKKHLNSDWNKTLHPHMHQEDGTDGDLLTSRIHEILPPTDPTGQITLPQLAGYYRCTFTNTLNGYQTHTPTARLFTFSVPPDFKKVVERSLPVGPYLLNQPFHFRCAPENVSVVQPLELQSYDVTQQLIFHWELDGLGARTDYVEKIEKNFRRYTVHPKNGDLFISHLTEEDRYFGLQARIDGFGRDAKFRLVCKQNHRHGAIDIKIHEFYKNGTRNIEPNNEPVTTRVVRPAFTQRGGEKFVKDYAPICNPQLLCHIDVVFAGPEAAQYGRRVRFDGKTFNNLQSFDSGVSFLVPEYVTPGVYTTVAELADSAGNVYDHINLQLTIASRPLMDNYFTFPINQNVFVGERVRLICNPKYKVENGTKFIINSRTVTRDYPDFIDYDPRYSNELTFPSVTRNMTTSIQCVSTNSEGTLNVNSILNVFNRPTLVQHPTESFIVESLASRKLFDLNCTFEMDPKTEVAKIYWRSNLDDTKEVAADDPGIKDAIIYQYIPNSGSLRAALQVELTPETDAFVRGTTWWCELEYKFFEDDDESFIVKGTPIAVATVQVSIAWSIVSYIAIGIAAFLLIIMIAVCFKKKLWKGRRRQGQVRSVENDYGYDYYYDNYYNSAPPPPKKGKNKKP